MVRLTLIPEIQADLHDSICKAIPSLISLLVEPSSYVPVSSCVYEHLTEYIHMSLLRMLGWNAANSETSRFAPEASLNW